MILGRAADEGEVQPADAAILAPQCGDSRDFVERVAREAKTALDQLDALESVVASLKAEAESLKDAETALPAIKTKFRGQATP